MSGLSLQLPIPARRAAIEPRRTRLGLTGGFAGVSARYCYSVFPLIVRELAHWRARAARIPDARLQTLALAALRKRGNMEGAALFAAFTPSEHRATTVRALVAYQAAYNYLDMLAEQPSEQPVANGRQLHQALLVALDPDAAHCDYYACHPQRQDDGFLHGMVDSVRESLAELPSANLVRGPARAAAERIVAFQSWNLGEAQGDCDGLERWARQQTPPESGLRWWETAAAGGSSLGVHAMLALAADPDAGHADVDLLERAYFPWICALHSLLDSIVDVGEDRRERQRNLLRYYASPSDAAARLQLLAEHAHRAASGAAGDRRHELVLATMESYYLSAARNDAAASAALRRAVLAGSDPLLSRALPLFKLARRVSGLVRGGG